MAEAPRPPHDPLAPLVAEKPVASAPSASPRVPDGPERQPGYRRLMVISGLVVVLTLGWLLRGVLVPLLFAFLLAYALDPLVDRMEALKVPRALGAILVMLGIVGLFALILVYAIPMFLDELRGTVLALPSQLESLAARVEPWMWKTFKIQLPHTMGDLGDAIGEKVQAQLPTMLSAAALALFGTLSYVAVLLSALIVPIFALYLLIDFDRIVLRVSELIPRRWFRPVREVAIQVHRTLGGYVRGQLTANVVLGALYAAGLRMVDIRLAVPIGVFTGMLAFVPYVGFFSGLGLALSMAVLDWHGFGTILGVIAVMGGVQVLDASLITPRIVGSSVGLAPLEVLVTMMAAASLFGFLGVILAVPLGAVVKILITRAARAYLASEFYARPPTRRKASAREPLALPRTGEPAPAGQKR